MISSERGPQSFLRKPGKLLSGTGHTRPPRIQDLCGAADPGRVRLGVDVEIELVRFLAQVETRPYSVPSVITTVINT